MITFAHKFKHLFILLMNKKIFVLLFNLLFCGGFVNAQEVQKSDLEKRAEAIDPKQNIASARSLYIHAFNDYYNKGQIGQGVECAVKATALYYKENFYKEAFDLLRRADDAINSSKQTASDKAASHYLVTKERLQMYMKLRKSESAKDQLNILESLAGQTSNEGVKNDLLYTKAIYYYTFGMNAQGNAVFKEMADKLTAQKEYDKVDEVYQTLIANGRKSNNANMVAQSYSNYIAWKDSANALKHADEIGALKQQIADNEAAISEKDSSLTTRQVIIVGLCVLLAALAAALVAGGVVLMRFILLTRKQKKAIKLANESDALKAKFISNISAQLEPTLQKLDSRIPEVKALLDFSNRIQTLSKLQNAPDEMSEVEEVQVQQFCEDQMDQIRDKVKNNVTLMVNVPKMNVTLHKDYVSHILLHLLNNAAEYTSEGGNIWLDFKKRSPHKYQFIVSDTGCGIPEEKCDDVFKPFLEIKDLATGDGLGLPICKQMAQNMKGDLSIDSSFTKGARFVLDLNI
ncbi:Histidine kinase-, DNA gyrase B-, and HSP90-like ATPase [Prevotella sp. khp7]|nr:Histidine kinase-, DNA gyrase B-, and HSP90-like ATPase [Prevotella sp. khp7]